MKLIASLLLICSVAFAPHASAQKDPVTSYGASIYGLPFGGALGVNYSYRKNFKEAGDGTLAWSVSPAAAIHYNQTTKEQFILDLPFLLTYNLGYGTTSSDNRGLGLLLGVGAGVHYLQNTGLGYGPQLAIGIRGKFLVPMEIKVNYHYNLFNVTADVLSLHFNFLLNQRN